ncbi:MAG TPA: acetone carboxylase [Micrococcaceae bacterium]
MNLLDMLDGQSIPPRSVCSRKGCRSAASTQLLWNNPKIHTPERRKVWLACGEHTEWLEDYLRTRGLWRETLPLTAAAGSDG